MKLEEKKIRSYLPAVSAIPPYPSFFKKGRDQSPSGESQAFTLIEVLLSLGILSVALLIVFGVLTPFLSQTGEVVETTTVNRIIDRIVAEVERLEFSELMGILNQNTSLYASQDGDRLALANDPQLDSRLPESERHFAITLRRNLDISPTARDSTAGYLAFQIRIKRILHAPDGSLIQSPLDHTLAIFNSAVTRTDS